jgi:ATP-dependent Clp protease ATP-binding subunit ClpA
MIPFTPRAKKVLELSLRESLSHGNNYICTEHILLGLARENEGVASRILLHFDADSNAIQAEVLRLLPAPGSRTSEAGPAVVTPHSAVPLMHHRELRLVAQLAAEIPQRLGRPADEGDYMLALSAVPGSVLALALGELGIDDRALAAAVDRARGAGATPLPRDGYDEALLRARARLGLGDPPATAG